MKKRAFVSIFLALALVTGFVPAKAAELPAPEGLSIVWYTDYEGLMRRYGTDRMLLVKDGRSGLFGLDGAKYTDCIFDAFGQFNGSGLAPACLNGQWGMVDLDGKTVVDFIYATAQNAEERTGAQVVQEPGGWKYAIADIDGNLLTPYQYWSTAKAFSNGMLAVFISQDEDGNSLGWGYVNEKGEEVIPCRYYSGGVGDFGEDGLAIVYSGPPYGYNVVDKEGRELLKEGAGRIWRAGCGLFGFSANFSPDDGSSVGFFDTEGNIVIEPQFAYRTNPKGMMQGNIFYEETGLAQVYQNGESFTIDTQGNRTDKADAFPDEDYVYAYHEGLVWENAEGRRDGGLWPGPWGFRDEQNNLVVPYVFDAVGYFDRGVAVVKSGDAFGLLKNPLLKDQVSDWAAEEVKAAEEAGYVTPSCEIYQTFTITRSQFAELAVNYVEKKTGKAIAPAPADTFTDTADETVLKACAAGIVQGMGDGTFSPGSPLTREQLAAMLWRAMRNAGAAAEGADLSAYADAGQVSSWAADSMAALVGLKVMAGTSGMTLSPKDFCTVEQAVLLVYRAAK